MITSSISSSFVSWDCSSGSGLVSSGFVSVGLSGFSFILRPGSGMMGFSNLRLRASRIGSRGSCGFGDGSFW